MMNRLGMITWMLFGGMMLYSFVAKAQGDESPAKRPLVFSAFNLGTQLPGSGIAGVFTIPIHPGITAGTEWRYNRHPNRQFFQTLKFGVYYHQYVQTGIQLYSEAGYRQHVFRGSFAELRLGGGYLHAFSGTEVFTLKNGEYVKKSAYSRPQFMATSSLALSYQFRKGKIPPRIFLEYQFFLQMPFVRNYIPLEPNTAFHAGVALPILK